MTRKPELRAVEEGETAEGLENKLANADGTITFTPEQLAIYHACLHEQMRGSIVESITKELEGKYQPIIDELTSRIVKQGIREEELARLLTKDPLTGVNNIRFLYENLDQRISEFARKKGSAGIGLIYIDFDHFKEVNDTYGHEDGNTVLTTIAEALEESVRGSDIVGRYGGDEFYVICPDTDEVGLRTVCENLMKNVYEKTGDIDFMDFGITASIGYGILTRTDVLFKYMGLSNEKIAKNFISEVDGATYNSKHAGRNKMTFVIDDIYVPFEGLNLE